MRAVGLSSSSTSASRASTFGASAIPVNKRMDEHQFKIALQPAMPAVRVIHWREAEAKPLLDACRGAGFEVDYLPGDGGATCRAIRAKLPDVFAIDLSRRPSHGLELAIWLRNTKQTRPIPIIFIGGEETKVSKLRAVLPDATYCELPKVVATLKKVIRAASRSPVTPTPIMNRYSERSAAQKLGIVEGGKVTVIEAPREFPGSSRRSSRVGGIPGRTRAPHTLVRT